MKTGRVFGFTAFLLLNALVSAAAQIIRPPGTECEFLQQRQRALDRSMLSSYAHDEHTRPGVLRPAGRLAEIVPDFQISENGGYAATGGVAWARNDDGQAVAAWIDGRHGGMTVMAQLMREGIPAGDPFLVDVLGVGYTGGGSVDAVVTSDDRIIFVYNNYYSCFAKVLDSDGTVVADRFQLNDPGVGGRSTCFVSAGADTAGRVLALWMDIRDGFYIYGQWFSSEGVLEGGNVQLSPDAAAYMSGVDVFVNKAGTAFMVWGVRYESDSTAIAGCLWPADAAEPNEAFIVSGSESDVWNHSPSVAGNGENTFAAAWQSHPDNGYNTNASVAVKVFDYSGGSFREERAGRFNSSFNQDTNLSMNSRGRLLVTSMCGEEGVLLIDERFEIGTAGYSIQLNDNISDLHAMLDDQDRATFFWRTYDWCAGAKKSNYYFQQYSWEGDAFFTEILIDSVPEGSCLQYEPQMAVFDDGGFAVTWADYRRGNDDYYLRCFNADGTPRGDAVQIFDWDGSFIHFHWHLLNADQQGNIVVTAYRCGGDGKGYVAQRFDSAGTRLGTNEYLLYSDFGELAYAAEIDHDGFTLIWSQTNLYMQRFDNAGTPIGDRIRVNDADNGIWTNWFEKKKRRFCSLKDGGIVAAWSGSWNYSAPKPAAVQRFAADGSRIGENIVLTDDQGTPVVCAPEILSDGDTLHYVLWSSNDNGGAVYRAQRFDSTWSKAGNSITIENLNGNTVWSMDAEGRIAAVWHGDADIYGQKYTADLQPLGGPFVINGASQAEQYGPVFSEIHDGCIYTAWADNRVPNTGFSIWGNILDWEDPERNSPVPADLIPAAITLGQNYPNPFNAETVIPYTLSGRTEVTLTIVDLRGRTVDVLERGIKAAGRHEAVWNAAGMTSGVYIVRLSAGSEVRVGKVLLVR